MANIIVAFPKSEDAKSIKNLLVRNGFTVTAVCTTGTKVLNVIDDYNDGIIVCGYKLSDMTFYQLRENLSKDFEMLLLASPAKIDNEHYEGVVSVSMPLKVFDLISTVEMLDSNISRKRRKRKEVPKKRNENDKKILDKAKAILMDRNSMTEEEAHRYIQKTSMDSGTNMVETAEMILRLMVI